MTGPPFLRTDLEQRRRLARRRRRRARLRLLGVLLAIAGAAFGALAARAGEERGVRGAEAVEAAAVGDRPPLQEALGPLPGALDPEARQPVRIPFGHPPRAGVLVDLDTGQVLWHRHADRALPVASLTKIMTAIVAHDELAPRDKVRISRRARDMGGSKVGMLPRRSRVRAEALLWGLMLPSGNDAAVALAEGVSGSVGAFVDDMNRHAARLGLRCTRFASPEGLSNRNRSCALDLAALARELLDRPRLARIVKRRKARLPFPVRGGRLELYNNNPLLRSRYPGALGVKTGYTRAAGRCLVAAARRDGRRLAVVLLRSRDPGRQARQLLDRGFRALA